MRCKICKRTQRHANRDIWWRQLQQCAKCFKPPRKIPSYDLTYTWKMI